MPVASWKKRFTVTLSLQEFEAFQRLAFSKGLSMDKAGYAVLRAYFDQIGLAKRNSTVNRANGS